MDDNVVVFPSSEPFIHTIDDRGSAPHVPVEDLLEGLKDREFDDLTVIGRLSDGSFYFASTSGSIPEINWDLDKAKDILLSTIEIGSYD